MSSILTSYPGHLPGKYTNQTEPNDNVLNSLIKTFKEFCVASSVHGLRYIGGRQRKWIERIWWILSVLLSMYLCGSFIRDLWSKWDASPVIMSMNHQLESIGTIPLPAITICPLNKISINKFNYTDAYRRINRMDGNLTKPLSQEELKRLKAAAQICDRLFSYEMLKKFPENETDKSIVETIRNMATGIDDSFFTCSLLSRFQTCYKYFHDIVTEQGVCYSFNLLTAGEVTTDITASDLTKQTQERNSKHWNVETGYDEANIGLHTKVFPHRTFTTGKMSGLQVVLKSDKQNTDDLCTGATGGFKITFHAPFEVPQVWRKSYHIAQKRSVNFIVTPKVSTASEGLRSIDPNVRQCFFKSERNLKYFKIYTQQNCEFECISNLTRADCGCVKYSMARNNDDIICGPAQLPCVGQTERKIVTTSRLNVCNCLPACDSMSYDVAISEANYDLVEVWNRTRLKGVIDFENSTFSHILITYKDELFRSVKRSELYNSSGFMANCGGLFGLFMGASLISLVEVVYYFTLRTFGTIHKQKKDANENTDESEKNQLWPYLP